MIVDVGLTEILKRAVGQSAGATLYIGVGTGTNAPAASDTALQTELVRVLASTTVVSGNVLNIKGFLNTSQGNGAIAETGLLTLAAAGILIDRSAVTPAQQKGATQEAIVEYNVTLSRA